MPIKPGLSINGEISFDRFLPQQMKEDKFVTVTRVSKQAIHQRKLYSVSQAKATPNELTSTIDHATKSTTLSKLSPSFSIDTLLPSRRSNNSSQKSTETVDERKTKHLHPYIFVVILLSMFFLLVVTAIVYAIVVINITETTTEPSTISETTVVLITTTTVSDTTTSSETTITSETTTSSATTTTIGLLSWNATGITVAGIGGSSGAAANELNSPFGVTLDSSDTLFIADRGNHRIQKWLSGASNGTTVAGQANGVSGTGLNFLNNPGNVLVNDSGHMYITEVFNHRVLSWPNGASLGSLIAGTGTAGSSNNSLSQPHDIAIDWNTGILYISEYANHRVMEYLPGASSGSVVAGGNGAGLANTQLLNPVGLYFDASSNSLFIANYGAHNIVRWVLGANNWTLVVGISGSPGSASMLLNNPADVTLDSMGNVFVADTGNHRIQFFPAGQSNGTTIAGTTGALGSTSTQFNLPFGVSLDSQRNVYVADYNNHRIQKFLRN